MTSRKFLDICRGGSAGTIVIQAKAGIQFLFDLLSYWTPTFVGVTNIPPPISNFLWDATLVDRLRSLKVKGEVIEKRMMGSFDGQSERHIVIVKFKNRIIETNVHYSEFERTEIGEQIWFSPPVPDRDPSNCHLFAWLIIGLLAGVLAIWTIVIHFDRKTAIILSLTAAGWIGIIVYARICTYEQNNYLRKLEMEIEFFLTDGAHEQGDRE